MRSRLKTQLGSPSPGESEGSIVFHALAERETGTGCPDLQLQVSLGLSRNLRHVGKAHRPKMRRLQTLSGNQESRAVSQPPKSTKSWHSPAPETTYSFLGLTVERAPT